MKSILHIEDGDAFGVQWPGAEPHLYRPGDDRGMQAAFVKAVSDGLARKETPDEDPARDVARLIQENRLGIRKDAGGDLILAWWVPQELAEAIAIPGGVPAADMHLTLCYLGPPEGYDLDLVAAVAKIHSTHASPLEGMIGGMGRFVGEGDKDVVVALMDVPGLENLRRCLYDDLMCHGAITYEQMEHATSHGFVPHVTLGYYEKTQTSPPPYTETIPVKIDNLAVAAGTSRIVYPLAPPRGMEDAEPSMGYYASKATSEAEAIRKQGRVLSSTSLDKISSALHAMQELLDYAAAKEARDGDLQDDGSVGGDDPAGQEGAGESDDTAEAGVAYLVTEKAKSKRYTLGPLYAPNRKDAHGDWIEEDTLQEALWDYVRMSSDEDRLLRLQHGDGDVTVGEWVEIVAWPYDHQITLKRADGSESKLDMPKGTVYMGVVWHPEFWDEEKAMPKGIGGLSLGGRAVKVATDIELEMMGDA